MSLKIRSRIGMWFALIIGMGLMSWQLYKYFIDALEPELLEGIIFIVAISLIFFPKSFADFVIKVAKTKSGVGDKD
jgi:Na+-translocating ferredoxin:NAD+ oxidoreductase RnfA subunit